MIPSTKRDSDRLIFRTTAPRFFKIVLDDTLRNKKLGIPRKFVRKYGNNLPNSTVLKVPNGDTWKVKLIKCDGEIWLQKGWQEFMEFYSLVYGSFLIFQLDKSNCHFNVIIFDRSTSEIHYPCRKNGENEVEVIDLEQEPMEPRTEQIIDKASLEILNCSSATQKRKEKSGSSAAQNMKKKKLENPAGQLEAKTGNGDVCEIAKIQQLNGDDKATVLNRARAAFKSENPFFMVVMQPSYVHPGNQLRIPARFVNKYFNKKYIDVILNVKDGRTWSVKCYNEKFNGKTTAKFYDGWKNFVQDNRLNVGDVCNFELISSKETTLRVVIYRNTNDEDNCPSLDNSKELELEKGNCGEAGKKLNPLNPFFKVVIKSAHLKKLPMFVSR